MQSNIFDPNEYYAELEQNVKEVREITDFVPKVAIILGTGLGTFADSVDVVAEIPYEKLSNFPVSTNPGHVGRFLLGRARGVDIVCMQGRIHFYEGYDPVDIVRPVRLMKMLGAETFICTNATGCVNPAYQPGDFVAVKSHIAHFVPSPLIGPTIHQFGEDFVDTSNIYDREIREALFDVAKKKNITLHSGVHLIETGRQFETPAEARMFSTLGADVIGMSCTNESIAAKHAGMKVVHIAFVSNLSGGFGGECTDEEVQEMGRKCAGDFKALIDGALDYIASTD